MNINEEVGNAQKLQKSYISLNETADYLGVSKSFLYKMTSTKQIPYYKPTGKLIYFKIEDLDKWISESKIEDSDSLNSQVDNYLNRDRYGN